jgi:hypothetical protein
MTNLTKISPCISTTTPTLQSLSGALLNVGDIRSCDVFSIGAATHDQPISKERLKYIRSVKETHGFLRDYLPPPSEEEIAELRCHAQHGVAWQPGKPARAIEAIKPHVAVLPSVLPAQHIPLSGYVYFADASGDIYINPQYLRRVGLLPLTDVAIAMERKRLVISKVEKYPLGSNTFLGRIDKFGFLKLGQTLFYDAGLTASYRFKIDIDGDAILVTSHKV